MTADSHGGVTPVARLKGISAKMGLDATKLVEYTGHAFTRVRIPGQDEVDLLLEVDHNPKFSLREFLGSEPDHHLRD